MTKFLHIIQNIISHYNEFNLILIFWQLAYIYVPLSLDKVILNSSCTWMVSGSNNKYLLHKICLDYIEIYISVLQVQRRHSSLMIHKQLSVLVWKASVLAFEDDYLHVGTTSYCNVEYLQLVSFILISYLCQEVFSFLY